MIVTLRDCTSALGVPVSSGVFAPLSGIARVCPHGALNAISTYSARGRTAWFPNSNATHSGETAAVLAANQDAREPRGPEVGTLEKYFAFDPPRSAAEDEVRRASETCTVIGAACSRPAGLCIRLDDSVSFEKRAQNEWRRETALRARRPVFSSPGGSR
jgi:hypothetical protein